ncbi:MAG: 2-C-methyl-D-erythritol 4-phosphate cytidylyltransferase [Methylococcaceae bacterium]|nr:MAG: 2-C-methyl-D-erythritol 4-phosphate cytidylyltransferase [Methylococcaceae bacterium]
MLQISTPVTPRCWGIVPAAGVGKRMAADRPKQYLPLLGKTVIEHTLERLLAAGVWAGIVVAVSPEDPYWPDLPIAGHPLIHTAPGGKERADSVFNALEYLQNQAHDEDWALVHDAARPCITASDVQRMITRLQHEPVGGILALPVHDTLKRVSGDAITATIDRSTIWRALTPQMFRLGALREALREAAANGSLVTDEASALELKGLQPKIVEGRPDNLKITRPEDLALAAFYLEQP